jgi:AcrR family transcriptional regulator
VRAAHQTARSPRGRTRRIRLDIRPIDRDDQTDRTVMMPRPAGRRTSREALLECAERLFAERGYGGIGLAEVAEGAKLGKSSLFHHFQTKSQLYAAVMARLLQRVDGELTAALAAGGGPVERLERWLDTLIDVLAAHPSYAPLLLRTQFEQDELASDLPEAKEADAALRRIVGHALRLLREGMEGGALRRASTAHTLQTLFGATVHPFATGRFGEELVGRSLFSPAEVRRRKVELKALLRQGLIAEASERTERRRERR